MESYRLDGPCLFPKPCRMTAGEISSQMNQGVGGSVSPFLQHRVGQGKEDPPAFHRLALIHEERT